jgi:hypothetical protein
MLDSYDGLSVDSLSFLDRFEVVEERVNTAFDGSLARFSVCFAFELETQFPQRHRAVEVVVPGQTLPAINDVMGPVWAQWCSTT